MYVAGKQIHDNGKVYERGDVVDGASSWPAYVLQAHLRCGSLLDVDKERLSEMKAEVRAARQLARRQQSERGLARLTEERQQVAADVELLARQLAERERRLREVDAEISRLEPERAPQRTPSPKVGERPGQCPHQTATSGGGAAVTASPPTPETATAEAPPVEPSVDHGQLELGATPASGR